ncbi:MAG: L-threonylcarbamoyladenylate synthase, partial [Nitrososphaerota archaeon]|nr:L-threonylcarbamoyladenylate synthase [Nitrososphaerota archaeon]
MPKARVLKIEEDIEGAVETAVSILERGGLVVYPTETCYGLAADITNIDAVFKVYSAKRRPVDRSLTAIVADLDMWMEYAYLDEKALKLIRRFNPGPLTIATWKKPRVPDIVNPRAFAARISSHRIATMIAKKLGRPITATSANIHREANPYGVEDILRQIGDSVDLILDYGLLPIRPVSTIVDLTYDPPKIERVYPHGSYRLEEILEA